MFCSCWIRPVLRPGYVTSCTCAQDSVPPANDAMSLLARPVRCGTGLICSGRFSAGSHRDVSEVCSHENVMANALFTSSIWALHCLCQFLYGCVLHCVPVLDNGRNIAIRGRSRNWCSSSDMWGTEGAFEMRFFNSSRRTIAATFQRVQMKIRHMHPKMK